MNDFLAFEILKIIEKGENNGFFTVRTDIMNMESFSDLTDPEYADVIHELENRRCISSFRNAEQNNVKCYKIEPAGKCLEKYRKRMEEDNQKEEAALQKEKNENEKLQLEIIDLQRKVFDYDQMKRQKRNAYIIGTATGTLGLLIALLQYLKCKG
jgi:hypothetical protein